MQNPTRSVNPWPALALLFVAYAGADAHETVSRQLSTQERAADEPEREAAVRSIEVSSLGPLLVIEPRVPGVATSIYVSCADGTYVHQELEGVGTALVDVVRDDGPSVANGVEVSCKYEVFVHPPVDRQAMRLAARRGDSATVERLSRIEEEQTVISRGRFRIAGGAALDLDDRASDE